MNGKLYLMILLSIGSAMCFLGWVINIVKLTRLDWQPPYKQEIIRSIGIIPPVGAIVGWIHIKE